MIQFAPESSGREEFEVFSRRLLLEDWERPDGPMRLSAEVQLADLAKADFFINARIFLTVLAEQDGAPMTDTGNLNRVFVGMIMGRLKFSKSFIKSVRSVNKVINEQDLWPLHLIRIICECGGLVGRWKKRLHLTKMGRGLLPDEQAGALFRNLFIAYFRRFDLQYDFPFRRVPDLQQTIAVILWRLDTVSRGWKSVRGIARKSCCLESSINCARR
jgi:hypothetical protein